MKTLNQQLTQYAAYHRDKRNVFSHFIGIPMIVFAVTILLSRPGVNLTGFLISPALLVALAAQFYYFRLDFRFGVAMALFLGLCLWGAQHIALLSTAQWLAWGIGLFVVGWIIQFVGHIYERRKPAFLDDVMGLAIGPLFVMAELAFLLGLRSDVQHAVEDQVGPCVIKTAAVH
ncbi:MAG: Mpo1-like protein [Ketobacter sp.]|nr:MAG: DUF962 domain-containing protein [Ketobacter sp.]